MPSAIDPTVPVSGNPTTASQRANWTTAKNEITALQAAAPSGTTAQLLSGAGTNVAVGTNLTLTGGTLNATGGGGSSVTTFLPSTATLRSPLQVTDNIVVYDSSNNSLRAGATQFSAYTLANGGSFTKTVAVTPIPLTWASTITINATQSINFRVTLGGATLFANPTGLVDGQRINLRIKQSTGGHTATWGSKWKWPLDTAPVLSTAANAVDWAKGIYTAADDVIEMDFTKGFASVVSGGGGGTGPVLDTVTVQPLVAVGLNLQRTAYAGQCLRIHSSGAIADADWGFDSGTGAFNSAGALAALTADGGAAGGFVKWYNQVAGGADPTQATAGTMPILFSGTPSTYLGSARCYFAGARYLTAPVTFGTTSTFMAVFVIDMTGANNYGAILSYKASGDSTDTGTGSFNAATDNSGTAGALRVYLERSGGLAVIPSISAAMHVVTVYQDGTNIGVSVDGGSAVTVAATGAIGNSGTVYIGARGDGANGFTGGIAALMLWNTYNATDRGKVEAWFKTKNGTP